MSYNDKNWSRKPTDDRQLLIKFVKKIQSQNKLLYFMKSY